MNKIDVPNLFDILKFQLDSFFDDLIWWTNALKNARETNIYGSARI